MGYAIDENELRAAMEDICKEQPRLNLAHCNCLRGWVPDFQKAIETWHTACLELKIGEGYVEHILEKHSAKDIIEAIENALIDQAEEFFDEMEAQAMTETKRMYTLIITKDDLTGIDTFYQSEDPEKVRAALTEWLAERLTEEEEVKQMSFEELITWAKGSFGNWYSMRWGCEGSEAKRVNVIATVDDCNEFETII